MKHYYPHVSCPRNADHRLWKMDSDDCRICTAHELLRRAEAFFTNIAFDGTDEDGEDMDNWLAEMRTLIYTG